jgi:hypothetical protein
VIKWLSKHVQKIELSVCGIGFGVELRDVSSEPTNSEHSQPAPKVATRNPAPADGPTQGRGDRVVTGNSWSERDVKRELDLMAIGGEVQVHVHNPGGRRPAYWVNHSTLQSSLNEWKKFQENAEPLFVEARNSKHQPARVGFAFKKPGGG